MTEIRLLVVDQDAQTSNLLQAAWNQPDWTVLQAEDTHSAREILHTLHPDVILLEWRQPEPSGLSWLLQLRQDGATKALPVIVFSAKSAMFDPVHAFDAGADDVVTKPFALKELHSRINAVLRRAASQRIRTGSLESVDA